MCSYHLQVQPNTQTNQPEIKPKHTRDFSTRWRKSPKERWRFVWKSVLAPLCGVWLWSPLSSCCFLLYETWFSHPWVFPQLPQPTPDDIVITHRSHARPMCGLRETVVFLFLSPSHFHCCSLSILRVASFLLSVSFICFVSLRFPSTVAFTASLFMAAVSVECRILLLADWPYSAERLSALWHALAFVCTVLWYMLSLLPWTEQPDCSLFPQSWPHRPDLLTYCDLGIAGQGQPWLSFSSGPIKGLLLLAFCPMGYLRPLLGFSLPLFRPSGTPFHVFIFLFQEKPVCSSVSQHVLFFSPHPLVNILPFQRHVYTHAWRTKFRATDSDGHVNKTR